MDIIPTNPRTRTALERAIEKKDYGSAYKIMDEMQRDASMFVSSAKSFKPNKAEINFGAINLDWSAQAVEFYNTVPELASAVDLTAKAISSCSLKVGRQDFQGNFKIIDDDPDLNALLRGLNGPSGDYHQILYQAALNLQVTGDGFLLANPVYDDYGAKIVDYEDWEFVSIFEIKATGKKKIVRDFTGGIVKYNWSTMEAMGESNLDENAYIARVWRRSPWHSQLADSPVRKNLPILKILSKLLDLTNAIANSQLSAGILLVPEELSYGSYDSALSDTEMAEDEIDPLTSAIIEYLSLPVSDRGSSASLAPLVFRGKSEYLKEIQHVRLGRDMDSQTRLIRAELLERLARGLGMPASMVNDVTGLSHWSANSVYSNFANNTCSPMGQMIADFLTRCYLQPMLRKRISEGSSQKDPNDIGHYKFFFDPAHIIARVDRGTQALRAFERGILSEKATRAALGFAESDARTTDERRQAVIVDLIKASPVTLAPCLLPLITGLEGVVDCLPLVDSEGNPIIRDQSPKSVGKKLLPDADADGRGGGIKKTPERNAGDPEPPDTDKQDADRSPGGPDEDRRDPENSRLSSHPEWSTLIMQLSALAHGQRMRTIEKAGNRIFSISKPLLDIHPKVDGKSHAEAVNLVATGAVEIGKGYESLLDEAFAFDALSEDTYETTKAWLEYWDYFSAEDREVVAEALGAEFARRVNDFLLVSVLIPEQRFENALTVPDEIASTSLDAILTNYGLEEDI